MDNLNSASLHSIVVDEEEIYVLSNDESIAVLEGADIGGVPLSEVGIPQFWWKIISGSDHKIGHPLIENLMERLCIFSPLLPRRAIWLSGLRVLCVIAPNSFVVVQHSFAEARDVIFQGKAKF
ncbi:hypothetical protein [Microbulbifer thermotolerans]|uniref:hypothetical protein n=1 Tax=Microbulbifer thermotolerans TaxID=252514 RepID=UPI00224951F1|nr:hypothetical protein [Microbulbifer thermotolerans]MCX2833144.1 hypothetical protein [Microbulbifer thermotolerans]